MSWRAGPVMPEGKQAIRPFIDGRIAVKRCVVVLCESITSGFP